MYEQNHRVEDGEVISGLYNKIVSEAAAAQRAEVEILKENRGRYISAKHLMGYIEPLSKAEAGEGQSQSVFELYRSSIKAHCDVLNGLADKIPAEDELFIEHCQVPVVLELLYQNDLSFMESMEVYAKTRAREKVRSGLKAACNTGLAHYAGTQPEQARTMDGPKLVLKNLDIPDIHKRAILMAEMWAENISLAAGWIFREEAELGTTLSEVAEKSTEIIELIYTDPIYVQAELVKKLGSGSFDAWRYLYGFQRQIDDPISNAIADGVHYANILAIPFYSIGSLSPVSQSAFNLAKDDLVMAVIESISGVIENSLKNAIDKFRSPEQPLIVAVGSTSCAVEYILELDGFSAPAVLSLLMKRRPKMTNILKSSTVEFQHLDFVDLVYNGWRYLDNTLRKGKAFSDKGVPVPKVSWFDIDLSPLSSDKVLMNPQRYTNPASPISARFSALMRLSDYTSLLYGPAMAVILTNLISMQKETPTLPAEIYKNYIIGRLTSSGNLNYPYSNAHLPDGSAFTLESN